MPYTLSILWRLELAPRFPGVDLAILAFCRNLAFTYFAEGLYREDEGP